MEGIVFVPGIFGSQLFYNAGSPEEIWPPGPLDALFGYLELAQLSDPARVSVGDIVDFAAPPLLPIYNTIEIALRDIANRINKADSGPYLPAPYDWRVDLVTAARGLQAQVTQWAADPRVTSITFFAHSMGGLVVRLLLESVLPGLPAADRPGWAAKVERAVFACTPHLGAPKAFALALGLTGDETLTPAQCRQLAANSAFAAAYELMPAPARNLLFDQIGGAFLPYDRADVAAALGLNAANLNAAARARGALNVANRFPAHVEYVFMYGTGLDTEEIFDINGLTTAGASVATQQDGDGTVPGWSVTEAAHAAAPPIPTWSGPGEHLALLSTPAFQQELYRYFGLGPPVAMAMAAAADALPSAGLAVHCNRRQYAPGASVQVLLAPDAPTETLSGTLQIFSVVATTAADGSRAYSLASAPVASKAVRVEGGPVKTHSVYMTAPTSPGAYQIVFGGDGATHGSAGRDGGWFYVRNDAQFPARGVQRRAPS